MAAEAHVSPRKGLLPPLCEDRVRGEEDEQSATPSEEKGNTWEMEDARGSSPLNLSWSPGCTRSFYSNQNGCRRPWRPQDPGSPWQPSGSGRLEPSCTGTMGNKACQEQQKHKATSPQSHLHTWLWFAIPKPEKGMKDTRRHALSKENHSKNFE